MQMRIAVQDIRKEKLTSGGIISSLLLHIACGKIILFRILGDWVERIRVDEGEYLTRSEQMET